MATVTQKRAFKPGRWKGQLFSAERLKQFAESTNAAIKAGVSIPALLNHAKPGADDKETARLSESAEHGAGWLKGVQFDPADGTLTYEMDVPKNVAADIESGAIKFTSPEFRDNYKAADLTFEGPVIRHVAFTPKPYLQEQGALAVAFSEGVYQFGEDDYEGPAEQSDPPDDNSGKESPAEPKNPDSPPKATDRSKIEALRECFSALGAELTSDWTPEKDGAVDELLAALKTLAKAKQEAEQKPKEPEEPEVNEATMPFSEQEIASLTPALQAKARKANDEAKAAAQKAIQFAEERASVKRRDAITAVKTAKLPPNLKKQLLALIQDAQAVQFSESGEQPTLTIQKAAEMFAAAVPPTMQFEESAVTESEHQDGEQFFEGNAASPMSSERARKINDRVDADLGYPPRKTTAA